MPINPTREITVKEIDAERKKKRTTHKTLYDNYIDSYSLNVA